jgi:hypothetical protein
MFVTQNNTEWDREAITVMLMVDYPPLKKPRLKRLHLDKLDDNQLAELATKRLNVEFRVK